MVIADTRLTDGRGTDLPLDYKLKRKVPVVIMNNENSEDLTTYSLKNGAYDYFVKTYFNIKLLPHLALKWIRDWEVETNRNQKSLRMFEKYLQLAESNTALSSVAV